MKIYLIDTNIIIYYANGSLPIEVKKIVNNILETSFNISVITKVEFLGWKRHTDKTFKEAKRFLSYGHVFRITNKIAEHAINLKREINIKTPDALIAATAIQHETILVTRNGDDFKNIKKLDILNPFENIK
ncbi:MAG: type II toxin-antitoxin system VapC family toxin [Desulfamplus sp.]|nr:type II toxin-antitoxin system VapC family toxin [Desulfamplus sp.]